MSNSSQMMRAPFDGSSPLTASLKAAKSPLPPDEARDRRITVLTTSNRNIKVQLRHMNQFYQKQSEQNGIMPFTTYAKLVTASAIAAGVL